MRIGFFTDVYLPTPTGTSVTVESFRKSLESQGHEVFIFAPEFSHYSDSIENITRLPSITYPNRPETPFAKPASKAHKKYIQDLDLDLIHTFGIYSVGNLGLEMGKRLKKPVVHSFDSLFTEHTKYYRPMFKPMAKWWYQDISKNHANHSQHVLVPSPSAKRLASEFGVVSPISIVPTGVDTSHFTALPPDSIRDRFEIPTGRHILLYVGRLDEENNIKFLLRAFKLVHQKREDVHLLIIGRGPQEEIYERIVDKQPFRDNVTFGGFMPKGELNKTYGACDIFLFPSTTATQGLAVIEAMAAGLPVVAINRLGPADIIRDDENGYLVPLNEKVFADRIIHLLENEKKRHNFGRVGRAYAKRFSNSNSIANLNKVYDKVTKE